jgi:chemotaxis protein CheD
MPAAAATQLTSPSADAGRPRRVVGIAEMIISSDPRELVVTYALGSCLGVTIYDPVARVGGLLHLMLPQAAISPDKAAANPFMFADTGIPKLFLESYQHGAKKERLIVSGAGGASFSCYEGDEAAIGQRNVTMLRKLLWKNGVLMKKHDFGGNEPRNLSLDVRTGEVTVSFGGMTRVVCEGKSG